MQGPAELPQPPHDQRATASQDIEALVEISHSAYRGLPPLRPDLPQHFLYFLPLPQGQGSLRPTRRC